MAQNLHRQVHAGVRIHPNGPMRVRFTSRHLTSWSIPMRSPHTFGDLAVLPAIPDSYAANLRIAFRPFGVRALMLDFLADITLLRDTTALALTQT